MQPRYAEIERKRKTHTQDFERQWLQKKARESREEEEESGKERKSARKNNEKEIKKQSKK